MKFKQLPLIAVLPLFIAVVLGCSDMSSSNSEELINEETVEESTNEETVEEASMQAENRIAEFEAEEARREAALAECNMIEDEQLRLECEVDVAAR